MIALLEFSPDRLDELSHYAGVCGEFWARHCLGCPAWGLALIRELLRDDPLSVGPYRLLGRLGTGGMGQVYLARSQGGRLVAVKVIRPELAQEPGFRARFSSEIAAARHVSGVYTAAVVDADPQAELPWMATAYVPGPSLADSVANNGPLPVKTVLALAAGLAEALAGIHRSGTVHRDLKPSNVLLAADGPRVIDFGISRAIERSSLTATGVVLGSPGFMSPEQARGQRDAGHPTDVFSLGAVLAFAATGIGPFGHGSTLALLYRVVNEDPDLTQVPARLRPLIERCLAKDPSDRPTPDRVLEILSDTADPSTGEWLPEAVAASIDRFHPTLYSPRHSLPTPQLPEAAGLADGADRQPNGVSRQPSAGGTSRLRKWPWPVGAAAAVIAAALVATILAALPGKSPPGPKASHSVTARPAVTASRTPTQVDQSPTLTGSSTAPTAAAYASAPLVTGSSSVTARVYFGRLKAVIRALASQVTFNTPTAWVDGESGRCALTVVFAGVANPKGAVYAHGLDSGWPALEYAPSQETERGHLHQQIVSPSRTPSVEKSWHPSAVVAAGSLQLTSDPYSLQFQRTVGATQTWLIDGQAVSCAG